jgi:hypothetical protein
MQNLGRTKFITLAVSRLYNTRISVVGVDSHRQWIRPMPMYQSDLYQDNEPTFGIFDVMEIDLNDWWGSSSRREDRFFSRTDPPYAKKVATHNPAERARLLRTLIDDSVDAIFSRGRTLGLIKPYVKDVNFRRNPFNPVEYEARFAFEDTLGGITHNWMSIDMSWHQKFQTFIRENPGQLSNKLKETKEELNSRECYFVIGLTRLFLEFPGPYGGCWPQVLGVIIL